MRAFHQHYQLVPSLLLMLLGACLSVPFTATAAAHPVLKVVVQVTHARVQLIAVALLDDGLHNPHADLVARGPRRDSLTNLSMSN